MTHIYTLDEKQAAADITHAHNETTFMQLLKEARLPTDALEFTRRKAKFHEGDELVAHVRCPIGHELALSLRDLRDNLQNRFFNDPAVVPHLCEVCAYPSSELSSKKSTVYHRLKLLAALYPHARHVSGFDATGKGWETYQCGNAHEDGVPHSMFQIRFDKLTNSAKEGKLRHVCYECGLLAGETPETKSKTIGMMTGRMKLINRAIRSKYAAALNEPSAAVAESNTHEVDNSGAISTTKTLLRFTCGNPDHAPVERSADNYFNAAKGGYCKLCLKAAGVKSVSELPVSNTN
jgi:hypothetical protein